jgi:hypothetical protein
MTIKLTPEQARAILTILQQGAPVVIGYGAERQEAYRRGWNAALDAAYQRIIGHQEVAPLGDDEA